MYSVSSETCHRDHNGFSEKIKEIFKSFSGKTEKNVGFSFRKDIGDYKILGQHMQSILFHLQISTCTEKVKFQAETVVLLPGTSSGQ